MKRTNYMEMIGILSLSLLITSPMTVSGSLPQILEEFSEYPRAMVENLMSIPSFPIMIIIALTPFLLKHIKEKTMVVTGLFFIGVAGVIPFFVTSFPVIFASRIGLGIGIGLVNTLAVSLIGERYTGDLRQRLQGIRCSMETLGEATLFFIAGQLLAFGWKAPFLVYGLALIILFIYIFFVPETENRREQNAQPEERKEKRKISPKSWSLIIKNALLGGLIVSTMTANALRLSTYLVETSLGTATEGSTILSISIYAGFFGGFLFGFLANRLQKLLFPVSAILTAVGLFGIVSTESLVVITIAASVCGMFMTIILSHMFNSLSDQFPAEDLNTANAIVLVGCNVGSFVTPFFLSIVGIINPSLHMGFLAYGVVYLILGVAALAKNIKK
ncbi:MAG: MFS transporter [Firmicutes bacterium]|nr:MFS transporter [Bacillota bacterium]